MNLAGKWAAVWGWLRGNRARVLLYHSISDSPADPFAVPPDRFRQQMGWLADQGVRVITAAEMEAAIRRGESLSRCVVLTFDDAFADLLELAAQVLLELGFPATVFVPTAQIGRLVAWRPGHPPRPVMDERQLASVLRMGFELGSHSASHASLPGLDQAALRSDLSDSLHVVRAATARNAIALAYPFGRAGGREKDAARVAGCRSAYLAGGLWGNGTRSDLFALVRDPVGWGTDMQRFAGLVTGRDDLNRLGRDAWRCGLRQASG